MSTGTEKIDNIVKFLRPRWQLLFSDFFIQNQPKELTNTYFKYKIIANKKQKTGDEKNYGIF